MMPPDTNVNIKGGTVTSMPQSKCRKYYKAAVAKYITLTGCGSVIVYMYAWPTSKVHIKLWQI